MPSPGVVVGATVLLHAIYSSYEYVCAAKLSRFENVSLPKDITIQIFVGLVLIVLSTISSGIKNMSPVQVSHKNIQNALKGEDTYAYLETRPNFQDLVAKRKGYLNWKKSQNNIDANTSATGEKS